MFKNILIATDLSRDSDEMTRCVASFYDKGCRNAHLVYGLDVDDVCGVKANLEQLVHGEIEKQRTALQGAGIKTSSHIAMRPVEQEIERIAAENNCDLIVVGSRIHSLAGEIAAGGVGAAMFSSARRPLLIMRFSHEHVASNPCCGAWPCVPLEHLLWPTDFSKNADYALSYIERFLQIVSAKRITLMHVQDKKKINPHLESRLREFNEIDNMRLQIVRERLEQTTGVKPDIELIYGYPSREIIDFCRRETVSLVVMGTHGRGYIEEMFTGSVSHNVARHVPAPVFLIPLPRERKGTSPIK